MAKYAVEFEGDYKHFVKYVEEKIIGGSMSASIEDKHTCRMNDVQCTILVFERYSYTGSNRVSLNVTILGHDNLIQLVAVTAGGSQGMFFKINTFGEGGFLSKLSGPVEEYIKQYKR